MYLLVVCGEIYNVQAYFSLTLSIIQHEHEFTQIQINTTWGEAKRKAQDRTRWKEAVVVLCPPWEEVE